MHCNGLMTVLGSSGAPFLGQNFEAKSRQEDPEMARDFLDCNYGLNAWNVQYYQ